MSRKSIINEYKGISHVLILEVFLSFLFFCPTSFFPLLLLFFQLNWYTLTFYLGPFETFLLLFQFSGFDLFFFFVLLYDFKFLFCKLNVLPLVFGVEVMKHFLEESKEFILRNYFFWFLVSLFLESINYYWGKFNEIFLSFKKRRRTFNCSSNGLIIYFMNSIPL